MAHILPHLCFSQVLELEKLATGRDGCRCAKLRVQMPAKDKLALLCGSLGTSTTPKRMMYTYAVFSDIEC